MLKRSPLICTMAILVLLSAFEACKPSASNTNWNNNENTRNPKPDGTEPPPLVKSKEEEFNDKLKQMWQGLKSFSANVHVIVQDLSEREPLVSVNGNMRYNHNEGGPHQVRVTLKAADKSGDRLEIAITGNKVDYYELNGGSEDLHLKCLGKAAKDVGISGGGGSFEQFFKKFNRRYLGEKMVNNISTTLIQLVSKSKMNLRLLDLWIDNNTMLPVEAVALVREDRFPEGLRITARLSDPKINPNIPQSIFQLRYSKDTEKHIDRCRGGTN